MGLGEWEREFHTHHTCTRTHTMTDLVEKSHTDTTPLTPAQDRNWTHTHTHTHTHTLTDKTHLCTHMKYAYTDSHSLLTHPHTLTPSQTCVKVLNILHKSNDISTAKSLATVAWQPTDGKVYFHPISLMDVYTLTLFTGTGCSRGN